MRCGGGARSAALRAFSRILLESREAIAAANAKDLAAARESTLDGPLLDRLALPDTKLQVLRSGVDDLASRADPIGAVRRRTRLDDGLDLTLVSSPLGVILVVFESRPDAVVQIVSLAVRSGNAVLLKGGSEAMETNRILIECARSALEECDLPADLVIGVEGRAAVASLLTRDDAIDLVIPRGSGAMVKAIQESTRIPVLGHAEGICHVYLDAAADPLRAERIVVDGVCDYPAACNSTETILVHKSFLPQFQAIRDALTQSGAHLVEPSFEADWTVEYGAPTANVRVVDSINEAIDHIHRYGSGHTDAIVTEDGATATQFMDEVDSASVLHNASTRFADGHRYGLGAEVGVATGRLHARGPVGVQGLLTTRWLLRGGGHVVSEYSNGERAFSWTDLPLEG